MSLYRFGQFRSHWLLMLTLIGSLAGGGGLVVVGRGRRWTIDRGSVGADNASAFGPG